MWCVGRRVVQLSVAGWPDPTCPSTHVCVVVAQYTNRKAVITLADQEMAMVGKVREKECRRVVDKENDTRRIVGRAWIGKKISVWNAEANYPSGALCDAWVARYSQPLRKVRRRHHFLPLLGEAWARADTGVCWPFCACVYVYVRVLRRVSWACCRGVCMQHST